MGVSIRIKYQILWGELGTLGTWNVEILKQPNVPRGNIGNMEHESQNLATCSPGNIGGTCFGAAQRRQNCLAAQRNF